MYYNSQKKVLSLGQICQKFNVMKRLFEMLALATALAISCQRVAEEIVQPQETPTEIAAATEAEIQQVNMYLEDDLVQQVEEALVAGSIQTKSAGFNSVLEQMEVVSMERLFPDAGEYEARHRKAGLHKWYKVSYRGSMPATKAKSSLIEIPGVQAVDIPQKVKLNSVSFFNDPYETNQWHYHNDGTGRGWKKGVDINVIPVWNNITTGSPNVIVGVVDQGVDFTHEDLAAHVDLANSYNFASHTTSINPGNHGTHVAGTIAAINNNSIGVAGIAGGNAAAGQAGSTILSCQMFDGDKQSDGAAAIIWAADHGAVIVNNSWGNDYSDVPNPEEKARSDHELYLLPNEGAYFTPTKHAIDYFNENAGMDKDTGKQVGPMAGGVVFFSAGNEGWAYGAPGCYPGAIAVGSVGPDGVAASYSNFGDWVDIAAPGGDDYGSVLSTAINNNYAYMNGTSMACPHVSGVAALIVAACGGPGFTREMLLEKLLKGTSKTIDTTPYKIGPLVDAWNAVNYGDTTPPEQVNTVSLSVMSNSIKASWKVTGHDEIPAAGFAVLFGKDKAKLEASTPQNLQEGVAAAYYTISAEKIGDSVSLVLEDLDFETMYYIRVYGYNNNMVYSTPSSTVSDKTAANNPPQISTSEPISNVRIKASETKVIQFTIVDPDAHKMTVTHTPGSAAENWRENPDGSFVLQIDGTKANPSSYSSRIVAKDSYGASSEAVVTYIIYENHAPVLVKAFDNVIMNTKGESVTLVLSEYFKDEDGDNLTYTANASSAALHVVANSGKLSFTALTDGQATISVKASDPVGRSVSTEFKVAVRTSGILVSAYPNPVTDYLYISNNEVQPRSMDVTLTASTGGVVYSATLSGSAFEPAVLDMTSMAPGIYTLIVTFNGEEYKQTVVKK